MIDKLKRKFILLATVSMLVLMTVLVGVMNIINYSVVVRESDEVISVLTRSDMPFFESSGSSVPGHTGANDKQFPPGMSPEVPYESRYFIVGVSPEGDIIKSDLSKILSVDKNSVSEYVEKAIKKGGESGFIKQFRYKKTIKDGNTTIIFLDCGRKLEAFGAFLQTSIIVGLCGCLIAFAAFVLFAGKIVKPIAESYEKQKRFISDAGHEMKTPLTIINANLDLLDGDVKCEELEDIRAQTKRMTELTNNLVLLSKMEESEHSLKKIEMPLSDTVSETVNSFRAIASAKNIDFSAALTPNAAIIGSPDSLRQLVSVLLENAMKYTTNGGMVKIALEVTKKNAVLTVYNTTAEPVNKDDLKYVFDRFYRTDVSRNSATGGHGIGLSIAKAITEAHGGSIKADTLSGNDFGVTVTLPLK